jgi:hypothetical protein
MATLPKPAHRVQGPSCQRFFLRNGASSSEIQTKNARSSPNSSGAPPPCISRTAQDRDTIIGWDPVTRSQRLKMPGYDALNDLIHKLDPKAYASALNGWLQATTGILPRSLASDGRSVGDSKCGMII